jgi:hypothetical protein
MLALKHQHKVAEIEIVDAVEIAEAGTFCGSEVPDDIVPFSSLGGNGMQRLGHGGGIVVVEHGETESRIGQVASRGRLADADRGAVAPVESLFCDKAADESAGTDDQ